MVQIIPHDKPVEQILEDYQKKSFDMSKKYFKWLSGTAISFFEYIIVAGLYLLLYETIGFERTFILLLIAIFVFVMRLSKRF